MYTWLSKSTAGAGSTDRCQTRAGESNGERPRSTASIASWLAAHSDDLSISCTGYQRCLWPMALSPLPADKPKKTLGTWGGYLVKAGGGALWQ